MTWRTFLLPKPRPFLARLAVLTGLLPIVGWMGGSFWILDLFNHFQVQFAVTLLIAVVVLLCLKAFRLAMLVSVFLILPVARLAPSYFGGFDYPIGTPLRFSTFNVLSANTRFSDAVDWIRVTQPDVIFLPEVDPAWAVGLRPLKESHPHVIEHIVEGNFGFALYSKLPILSQEIIPCGELELPLLKARMTGPRGEFTFFGAHPVPPSTEFWAKERDIFLRILGEEVGEVSSTVIVAGDLNATRWSYSMKPLWSAGLKDSSLGHGAGSTWMRGNPVVAVPIDHLLFRDALDRPELANCRDRWIGPDLGSDHRPVVADIAW